MISMRFIEKMSIKKNSFERDFKTNECVTSSIGLKVSLKYELHKMCVKNFLYLYSEIK